MSSLGRANFSVLRVFLFAVDCHKLMYNFGEGDSQSLDFCAVFLIGLKKYVFWKEEREMH